MMAQQILAELVEGGSVVAAQQSCADRERRERDQIFQSAKIGIRKRERERGPAT